MLDEERKFGSGKNGYGIECGKKKRKSKEEVVDRDGM